MITHTHTHIHEESFQSIEFEGHSTQEFRFTLVVLTVLPSFLIKTLHSPGVADIPTMGVRRTVLRCLEIPASSITRERLPHFAEREMVSAEQAKNGQQY